MKDIMEYCIGKGLNYWEYVQRYEDADLWDYLAEVWQKMKESIKRGLTE